MATLQTKLGKSFPIPALVDLPVLITGKTYPVIIFIGGTGQAERLDTLDDYGPHSWSQAQRNALLSVNGISETPIYISIAPGMWQTIQFVDGVVEDIFSKYPIDRSRVYVTGFSMGGGIWNAYVADPNYAKKVTAVYSVQGVRANENDMANNFATIGGKWAGVEGINDPRGGDLVVKAMNAKAPGSATLEIIKSGPGSGHDSFQIFYAPNYKVNGEDWPVWLLKQRKTPAVTEPVVVPPVTPVPVKEVFKIITVYKDGSVDVKP